MTDIVDVFEKLPPFTGLTWRGAPGGLIASLPLTGPLPTTRDPRLASANFTTACVWAIVSVAGRDIAPLSQDRAAQEIVVLPGGVLTPASSVHDVSGVALQVVLEVRDGFAVGAVPGDDELAALLDAARAAGPAEIRQPGRFG